MPKLTGGFIFALLAAALVIGGLLLWGGRASATWDADCDGAITAGDARAVLQYEAGLAALDCAGHADANGDRRIDSRDAAVVLQYLAGALVKAVRDSDTAPTPTPCALEGCPTTTATSSPTHTATPCVKNCTPTPVLPTATIILPTPCVGCPPPTPPPCCDWHTTVDVQFSISVDVDRDGVSECGTKDNDPRVCSLAQDQAFEVQVNVDRLPSNAEGYAGFDVVLGFEGVTSKDDPSAEAWPACYFEVSFVWPEHWFAIGCGYGLDASPSFHLGTIVMAELHCTKNGTVSLFHGVGNTALWGPNLDMHLEAAGGSETLTINCG